MPQSLVAVRTFIFLPPQVIFLVPRVIAVFASQVQHFKA